MFTYCIRNFILKRQTLSTPPLWRPLLSPQHTRKHCTVSSDGEQDQVVALLQLCVDRHYISPGQRNVELFRQGRSCSYGPLGMELKRNLLEQWWHSVTRSSAQVFGINTLNSGKDTAAEGQGHFRIVESENLEQIFQQKQLSKEEVIQKVRELLQNSPSVRASLFQGKVPQCSNKFRV